LVGLPVEELEKGYKVLVHCRAGKGRTGTTIAIILARIEDPSATPIKCCGPLAQHLLFEPNDGRRPRRQRWEGIGYQV